MAGIGDRAHLLWRSCRAHAIGRTDGFSLVELVIVMAIFGLLATAAIPSMSTMLANGRVRVATENLQAGLAIAQMQALQGSRRAELFLTTSEPTASNVGSAAASAEASNWMVRLPKTKPAASAVFNSSGAAPARMHARRK